MNTEQIQAAIENGVAKALIEVRKDDATKYSIMVQLVQPFKDHLVESQQQMTIIRNELTQMSEDKAKLEQLVYQYKAELDARGIDHPNNHSQD
jgi:hypothetical protein